MQFALPDQKQLKHLNSIAHEGKVVVFATAADGQIYYSVRQDGFEESYLKAPEGERTGWEQWQLL